MKRRPAGLRRFGGVCWLGLALAGGACSTHPPVPATGGIVAPVPDELASLLERNLERSARACRKTIEELGFVLRSHDQDRRHAVFTASDAGDQLLEIRLEQASAGSTRLKIRSPDETLRNAVLARLNSNL